MPGESIRKIGIPVALYEKVEAKIKGTEFRTVSDYVEFVLTELLSSEPVDKPRKMTKEEQADVNERLRALGYLD